jgi:hypothetical protein
MLLRLWTSQLDRYNSCHAFLHSAVCSLSVCPMCHSNCFLLPRGHVLWCSNGQHSGWSGYYSCHAFLHSAVCFLSVCPMCRSNCFLLPRGHVLCYSDGQHPGWSGKIPPAPTSTIGSQVRYQWHTPQIHWNFESYNFSINKFYIFVFPFCHILFTSPRPPPECVFFTFQD